MSMVGVRIKNDFRLNVVVEFYNLSYETEEYKFKASLSNLMRLCLRIKCKMSAGAKTWW